MPTATEQRRKKTKPAQKQNRQPGREHQMHPRPKYVPDDYRPAGKLRGKTGLITGGDSGIGRAVAVLYAKEGADVAIVYLNEHKDADETRSLVEQEGRKCITIAGDVGDERFCKDAVEKVVREFGKLDILVNNAAEQHPQKDVSDITAQQFERTFRTNIFSMFFLIKAALKHMKEGAAIINTASVTAYRGSPGLLDYSATKGAIVSLTRSLGEAMAPKGIRVNGVAPGPVWTPLIPSTFPPEKVEKFGAEIPMGRPAEPAEIAPCYVFLASGDAAFFAGQILHPNGGEIVNA
ncbi:MAG TPA: SDR family oxidoreductase [Tepidisphaeraceae bacterium]|jgi:NAD(P)-dependent dehydrogenase (short-subunit alcohol dehydrogenase family)